MGLKLHFSKALVNHPFIQQMFLYCFLMPHAVLGAGGIVWARQTHLFVMEVIFWSGLVGNKQQNKPEATRLFHIVRTAMKTLKLKEAMGI